MNLLRIDDLSRKQMLSLISFVSFTTNIEMQLINSLDDSDNAVLVSLLNEIANQGIERFDILRYRYYVRNFEMSISRLSTAEKVFLISYAANKSRKLIYLSFGLRQLSHSTTRIFMDNFGSSNYINLVFYENVPYRFRLSEAVI